MIAKSVIQHDLRTYCRKGVCSSSARDVEVRENLLVKMININDSFRFTKNVYHSYTCFNQKIVLLRSANMDTL